MELNEILLKTNDSMSDSTTYENTQLDGHIQQQVGQPQGRDDVEVEYAAVSIRHIVQSELLTEDDLLLVSSLCDHYTEEQSVAHPCNSSLLSNSWWWLTVGIVVVSVAVLSTPLIISTCIITILAIITVYQIKCYYRLSLVRRGDSSLQAYLKQFDNVLVLFTKCLRLIQETEVISRGYTRLTAWMPVSRIERQGTAGYHCVVLRRCIVKVCECLLGGIKPVSDKLCNNFPLKLELAEYQQPPLLEGLVQEEDVLSMESLKLHIRQVAVHNSALLRIIALSLDGGLPLSDLPSILPTGIVCDAHSSLKRSYEFHRNSVFDKPLSTVHKSSTKQQTSCETTLVEELTSMDIRTQIILKRLRELTEKFSEVTPDVETVKDALLELEGDYQVIQEQCRLTIKMINKQEHHPMSSSSSSVMADNDAASKSDSESDRSECCSDDQSSSDSSDEVFEGLASGSENGGDESHWQEGTKEDKETSIAMIKELRNVLTVRTTSKTSLKLKRPRTRYKNVKKKEKIMLQSNQRSADQLNQDGPDSDISKQCTAILPDVSADMQQDDKIVANTMDNHIPPCDIERPHDTEDSNLQDSLHRVSNDGECCQKLLMEDAHPIMMRYVATMAAKMALQQSAGSDKHEEVFGSEQ